MRTARASERAVLRPVPHHRSPFPPAVFDAAAPPDDALRRRGDPERVELAVARRVPLLQQVRAHDRERPFRADLGAAVALDRRRDSPPPHTRRTSCTGERALMRRGLPCRGRTGGSATRSSDASTDRPCTGRCRGCGSDATRAISCRVKRRERAPPLNASTAATFRAPTGRARRSRSGRASRRRLRSLVSGATVESLPCRWNISRYSATVMPCAAIRCDPPTIFSQRPQRWH